jgi:hypothetical protein
LQSPGSDLGPPARRVHSPGQLGQASVQCPQPFEDLADRRRQVHPLMLGVPGAREAGKLLFGCAQAIGHGEDGIGHGGPS